MTKKYVIGLDYGTLSGRAVLVDVENGDVVAQHTKAYPHGVMETELPDGTRLPADWALEHPQDFLDVLDECVLQIMSASGILPVDVIGIGVDFTASTVLPVDADGKPLCFEPRFASEPHAWVKLWKHHGAREQAKRMTELARENEEDFLAEYGGVVNAEWGIPKLLETLEKAPEVYRAADCFMEAGDWIVRVLTGENVRSTSIAGYKELWRKQEGPLSPDYLGQLHPEFARLTEEKLKGKLVGLGEKAGYLTEEMAKRLGLCEGIVVTAAVVDGHVAVPALGISGPDKAMIVVGTSSCVMTNSAKKECVPGIFGLVEDGMLPGLFGYEAGQTCVGDMFDWFVKNCVPENYQQEARKREMNIHQFLTEKASKLNVGESGLVALDWWNGNRSCLSDSELTGLILGMTLQTKPEEMYRALIESTAYGMRVILDNYEEHGVSIREIRACGGITKKNPMMMQIYADVCNREIMIGTSDQSPALGAAIWSAVAAGTAAGGYDSVETAAERMGHVEDVVYRPIPENVAAYEKLYREFKLLHDYFGRGENDVMKRLRRIKDEAKARQ